jgi:hypothetical protein
MKIDALQRYQRHHQGRFDDLALPQRLEAERILRRLCARRQGKVPRWLFAILCGRAKRLVLHPPDREWGKRMLAKRAGYARQRAARLRGEVATEKATRARRIKRLIKQQWKASNQPATVVAPDPGVVRSPINGRPTVAAAPTATRSLRRGAESVSCGHDASTLARLSEALSSGRPLGRDARLARRRDRES